MKYWFFLYFLSSGVYAQELLTSLNETDSQQRRQGKWILWMDAAWHPTSDSSKVAYYRLITYKDDKPVGLTTDYYRDGTKQYEGILLQDRPEEILDGIQTWFYPNGQKRIIEKYTKGRAIEAPLVYLRTGVSAEENWIEHYRTANRLSDEKNYEAAAKEFLIALENAEAFTGTESEEYATVADWLSIMHGIMGNYSSAILYKEAFVRARKIIFPAPDTLLINALAELGSFYKLEKNWSKAKACFLEFLDNNSRYFQGHHPDYPEAIQTFGTVCEALHEYDAALDYLTTAKKIFDAHPDQYEYPRLSNIFSLSSLYLTLGEFSKGEQLLMQEMGQLKRQHGEKSEIYSTALGSLARLHVGSGQYALAFREWTAQLSLIQAMESEQSETYAATLGSLAELAVLQGDLALADREIQQARKIYDKKHSEDESYLEFLQKISLIYGMMGNHHALQEASMQRKNLAMKLFGAGSLYYARTLIALLETAFQEKNWALCEDLAHNAIAIYKKQNFSSLNEQDRSSFALLRSRLGTVYLMQILTSPDNTKLAAAEEEVQKAISIFNSLPEKTFSVDVSDTYLMLATIYELKLETKQADNYYNYVLTNAQRQWGETHPVLIEIYFLVAKKSEIRKDYRKSLTYYQEAISRHQLYIQKVFPYLSEIEKEQFYASNKLMLTSFIGFATLHHQKVPGLSELLYNVILSQKGIVLESFQPIREAIFSSGNKLLQQRFNEWQAVKNEFARQQQASINPDTLRQLSDRLNSLEKEISAEAKTLNVSFNKLPVSWKDIQKSLLPTEAAVEILYAVEDHEEGYDTAYHALIVKAGIHEPIVVRLASASEAEGKAFRRYKNSIVARLEDLASYNFYWKALDPHLQGIERVYLAPDGIYHQICLSALINPETKHYLTEERSIVSMPSTSWLTRARQLRKLTQATFFAHPTYGSKPTSSPANLTRSLDLENIQELPGTEKELNDLTALFEKYNIKYTSYEGVHATEENIKEIIRPSVLHIATHGYFLPAQHATDQPKQNPLLQSGLLLAQCQMKPHLQDSRKEDGILTAYEASTLPLYKTALVILSACETGLGEVRNGEGVYGLQRAFFLAGSERVIMSLWKVDDEATHQFMVGFYENWIKTSNIDLAFQSAQNSVRATHPDPYYWAAFVMSGY